MSEAGLPCGPMAWGAVGDSSSESVVPGSGQPIANGCG
jgi:hypothetical protein